MCGRYFIDADFERMISFYERFLGHIDISSHVRNEMEAISRTGRKADMPFDGSFIEVFPSDRMAVISRDVATEKPVVAIARWGFSSPSLNKLVINARIETIGDKPMFRGRRKCIVPSSGYFEWTGEKKSRVKRIILPKSGALGHERGEWTSFAGLLDDSREEEGRFVIITREAHDEIRKIHDRMPFLLKSESEMCEYMMNT
jgi:putative SOS response-associated peptidase YedK